MAAEMLTARKVQTAKADGKRVMLCDGRGLYLCVEPGGAKSWLFRYKLAGRSHWLGLGAFPAVSLADAREKTLAHRKMLDAGTDPLAEKALKRVGERTITFAAAAEKLIEAKAGEWKPRTLQQWRSTIRDHTKPLAHLNVKDIDTATVFGLLEPLWATAQPTAMRVRNYIETVLDWCTAHAYRTGDNPAAWEGNMQHMGLSAEREHKAREHVPPAEIAAVMASLRSLPASGAALALQMVMLTATRANETLGATWDEFDMDKRVWNIPADRMKVGVAHRVPLTDAMLDVLAKAGEERTGLVFRSARGGSKMADVRLREIMHKLGRTETVHGMRSTFSQWAKERGERFELYETALAHAVGSGMERLYGSTDLLEQRRPVMAAWSDYLSGTVTDGENIVPFKSVG